MKLLKRRRRISDAEMKAIHADLLAYAVRRDMDRERNPTNERTEDQIRALGIAQWIAFLYGNDDSVGVLREMVDAARARAR